MNRAVFLGAMCTGLLLGANCSQQGPATSTGSGGSSGGTTTSVGGSGGSGGAQSSGGTSATGGATSAGGTISAGGTTGNGGASSGGVSDNGGASSGGVTGNGGATKADAAAAGGTSAGGTIGNGGTGAGGTTAKGGTTGSTGGAPASGGVQGSGGTVATGGTSASGGAPGSGGATGAGGSSGALSPADIVPDLDGFYWEGTCSGNVSVSGKNCPLYDNGATNCPQGSSWATTGTIRDKTLSVKGTTGTQYTITFEARGVIGARCYTGGKAATTAASSVTGQNNWWYVGGQQAGDSIWNTYELHVSPAVPNEANAYFFNAAQPSPDWCSKEASYEVKYTASFKVLGGGTMKMTVHDSNCQGQQNCGSNEGSTTCDSPRSNIDLSGMSPAATFKQPPTNTVGTKTYYPQWLYIDVKSVTSP